MGILKKLGLILFLEVSTLESKMTSSEIAQLWSTYMSNSMFKERLRYFLAKCEDAEIYSILDSALHIANEIVKGTGEFFKRENFPVPNGFTDEDVNINAPRIYTDTFFLHNIHDLSQYGLSAHSLSLSVAVSPDIRDFFTECLSRTSDLYNKSTELLVKKGLYVPEPSVPAPEKVDFVHRQSFLTGWFGDRRPLTVIEINNLVFNLRGSAMSKALLMGSSQVAESKEVREYFVKGVELAQQHVERFQSILSENGLPAQPTYESEVTNSTVPPFSDKLMMFNISTIATIAGIRFGAALGTSTRRDIGIRFAQSVTEVLKYAEDGANIMINHGWLEQPPTAADREALARV